MKKTITYLVVFLVTLVSNKVVSQSASANANAIIKIAGPLTLTKNTDLNFGTISASNQTGMLILSPNGTVTTNGGVTIVDQSMLSAASFGIFGPSDTSYSITLPSYVELKNDLSTSMPMYGINSNPDGIGTLGPTGTGTLLVGASVTVGASQAEGVYQGTFEVTVNLN